MSKKSKKIETKKDLSRMDQREAKKEVKEPREKLRDLPRAELRGKSPVYGAAEKCQAVLSLWTERRRPAEVCRELDIPYMTLNHWQNRALEGMLQALEPRVRMDQGPALSPRLQAMLEKRSSVIGTKKAVGRLAERLVQIQGKKDLSREGSRGVESRGHSEHPKSP